MSKKKKKSGKKTNPKAPGPKTATGKAISSMNALDHGGYCPTLLPTEDPKEYAAFRQEVWRDLAPANGIESILAEEIIFDTWRLIRLARFESRNPQPQTDSEEEKAAWLDKFRKLTNLRGRIQRARDRKLAELEAYQDERRRAECQGMAVQEYRAHKVQRNYIPHGSPRPFHPSQISLEAFMEMSAGWQAQEPADATEAETEVVPPPDDDSPEPTTF